MRAQVEKKAIHRAGQTGFKRIQRHPAQPRVLKCGARIQPPRSKGGSRRRVLQGCGPELDCAVLLHGEINLQGFSVQRRKATGGDIGIAARSDIDPALTVTPFDGAFQPKRTLLAQRIKAPYPAKAAISLRIKLHPQDGRLKRGAAKRKGISLRLQPGAQITLRCLQGGGACDNAG